METLGILQLLFGLVPVIFFSSFFNSINVFTLPFFKRCLFAQEKSDNFYRVSLANNTLWNSEFTEQRKAVLVYVSPLPVCLSTII